MGTFMASNKHIVVSNVSTSAVLQVDVATTLSFYIAERVQNIALAEVTYRVVKIDGRSESVLNDWVVIPATVDDIYTFDCTVTGITTSNSIRLDFKIVDIDGLETFISNTDINVIS
jgi:hypothetical protein